ncbi:DUF3574 domain-containing protein [bacterium]|nr:DUF3574 domain-containing protein [bacterium]
MERVSVVFHLPIINNEGRYFNPDDIEVFINRVIRMAGGMTLLRCEGVWVHPSGHLLQEQVMRVMVATPEDEVEELVTYIHRELKETFEQEAVYMEVDGKPSIR